jgi:hypothetical protein
VPKLCLASRLREEAEQRFHKLEGFRDMFKREVSAATRGGEPSELADVILKMELAEVGGNAISAAVRAHASRAKGGVAAAGARESNPRLAAKRLTRALADYERDTGVALTPDTAASVLKNAAAIISLSGSERQLRRIIQKRAETRGD